MSEIILVEWKSNIAQMVAEQRAYITTLEKANDTVTKLNTNTQTQGERTQKTQKTVTQQYLAQDGIINKLRFSINQLTAARDKSNSPALITKYNKLIDEQNAKLKSLTSTQQQVVKTQQQAIANTGSQFASLKNIALSLGPAIGVAFGTEQIVNFARESVRAASDFNENYSKSEVLFGNSMGKVAEFAKTAATEIGQSQNDALEGASTFAVFGRSAGLAGDDLADFSIDLVKLSSDLASFGNTTPEEAVIAVGAALRGESEPIRRYGVLLDDATLRNEAFKLGIISSTKEALTPQQRVLAAQAAIYRQTTAAQGDFARTSDQLANQQRILAAQLENTQIIAGQKLLPALLDVTGAVSSAFSGDFDLALNKLDAFSEKVNPLGVGIGSLISAADNLVDAFKAFNSGDYEDALERVGVAIADIFTATNPAIGGVRLFAREIGLFNDGLTEAELIEQRFEARQATFNKAVLDGGDALEVFYTRAKELLGATREQFDAYVATQRKKILGDQQDNEKIEKKVTLLQMLSKELAETNDRVKNVIAAGGIVKQQDLDRISELEAKLAAVNSIYARLREQQKNPDFGAPVSVPEAAGLDLGTDSVQDLETANMGKNAEERDAILAKENDSFKKYYQARRDFLAQYAQTDDERNKLQYENDLDNLNDALAQRLISEQEYQEKRLEITNKYEDLQKQATVGRINGAISFLSEVVSFVGQFFESSFAEEQKLIDRQANEETKRINESALTKEEKEKKIKEINKKAAEEQYQLQVKQFRVSQALQISNAAINGAQAAIAAFSSGAATPLIGPAVGAAFAAIAAGFALTQIGLIASQQPPPPPSYFKGTPYLNRGKNPAGIDTIPVMANEGEAIIPTSENKKYPGLAKAWIGGNLENYLHKTFGAPLIQEQENKKREVEKKELAEMLSVNMTSSFDDFRLYITTKEGNSYLKKIADSLDKNPPKRTIR